MQQRAPRVVQRTAHARTRPEPRDWFREHAPRVRKTLMESDRQPWLQTLRGSIEGWERDHRNVVLACSALTVASRHTLIPLNCRIPLVYLKGPFELIQARLAHRLHHFMPSNLLVDQFAQLEEPSDAIVINIAQAPAKILTDIKAHLHQPP